VIHARLKYSWVYLITLTPSFTFHFTSTCPVSTLHNRSSRTIARLKLKQLKTHTKTSPKNWPAVTPDSQPMVSWGKWYFEILIKLSLIPNFYGSFLYMSTRRGGKKSWNSIRLVTQKNCSSETVQNWTQPEQHGKMTLFLLLSSMPRTLITTKVKLRHIPSIGENTQRFSAPKGSKPTTTFSP